MRKGISLNHICLVNRINLHNSVESQRSSYRRVVDKAVHVNRPVRNKESQEMQKERQWKREDRNNLILTVQEEIHRQSVEGGKRNHVKTSEQRTLSVQANCDQL